MITQVVVLLLALVLLNLSAATEPVRPADTRPSASPAFVWVDAFVDPGGQPLAAYQFELKATGAEVTLVGIEGGSDPAFATPPYYDPRANLQNRIVIAALNPGDALPNVPTRVARVMLRVTGGVPHYSAHLDVAATINGKKIPARLSLSEGEAR